MDTPLCRDELHGAIWRNDFGLELRVLHGDELVESRLSRVGEAPLLLIAEEVKERLMAQGWTEAPNGHESGEDDYLGAPRTAAASLVALDRIKLACSGVKPS